MVVDLAIRSLRLSNSKVAPQTGASQTARQSATRTGFGTTCLTALRIPTQKAHNKRLSTLLRRPAVLLRHVQRGGLPQARRPAGMDQASSSHRRSAWSISLSALAGSAPARPVILSLGIAMTLSTIACDSSFKPVVLPVGTGMRNRGASSRWLGL